MIERIKTDTNNADDIIYRNITIQGQNITLVYSEVPVSYTHLDVYKRQTPGSVLNISFPTMSLESYSTPNRL